jgi:hypothetical protein
MAREDVNIKVSADVAQAIQMWKAMEEGPEAMAKSLEGMGRRGRTATKDVLDNLAGMAAQWISIAALINAAQQAAQSYFTTVRQIEESQAKAFTTADSAVRQYFGRARIRDPAQQEASIGRIGEAALRARAGFGEAATGARLLTEFGVGRAEAEGATLDELLTLQDALPGGQNFESFARRVMQVIRRSGEKVNARTIRRYGATAAGLVGRVPGFDENIMSAYAWVASDARKAGLGGEEGLAMFAMMAGEDDPRRATTKFRSLFDDRLSPGERQQQQELRAQARNLIGGSAKDYLIAAEIADQGAQARADESATAETMARYRRGAISADEARQRLSAVLGTGGFTEFQQARALATFNDPFGPDYLYSVESRVNTALGSLIPQGADISQGQAQQLRGWREQVMGRQPINIRLVAPDGRDIPTEVEANQLNPR